ncbi:MAG: hypothetical protein V7K97_08475 [Nostoc sp.]|uniref:hypothetical protein n=1 Tax=Nostoc sp. TaxID=1180 RepID=UPI002FF879F2
MEVRSNCIAYKERRRSIRGSLGGAERNPTDIRMLALAKPPTPLATTRETRAMQWLPNKAIFLQHFSLVTPLRIFPKSNMSPIEERRRIVRRRHHYIYI